MTPERWNQIEVVFSAAVDKDPGERQAYIDEMCAHDAGLRAHVNNLLAEDEKAAKENFLEETVSWPPTSTEPDEDMIGRRIGAYEIKQLLGRGGMGHVYLAVDDELNIRVAVKIVRPGMDTEEVLRQFNHEKRLHAALNGHPNIAGVMSAGATEDGQPYFVMEYIEGERIDRYCDNRNLSIHNRVTLFRSVLSAVQYAHQNLVIHLDLKPSNILVTKEGVPKLVDFGISRLTNPDLGDHTSAPIGPKRFMTRQYASPEQVRRDPIITTTSDVYSLGVVLYELLTGHRPYHLEDRSEQGIERTVCEEDPERPSIVISRDLTVRKQDGTMRTLTPEDTSGLRDCRPSRLRRILARDIDKILPKALRKEPQRRFNSVTEFSGALRDWLEWRPVHIAPRPTSLEKFQCWCHRNPAVTALAAVVIALILLVSVVTTVWYVQISDALATTKEALKQEEQFRLAFLKNADFKHREEAVVNVAKDPRLLELLEKTAHETKDLCDKLNDPKLDSEVKKGLKEQLQQHATRKELQQHLKALGEAQNRAKPIYNWYLLDSEGLLLAREPARPSYMGDNFAWRTYFHGGTRDYEDLQDYLNNAAGEHVSKPHLSAALESGHTGKPLWAVSAPVIDEKGEFVGVVGLRVEIGQAPDASSARR